MLRIAAPRIHSPIADRVGISQHATAQKFCMHADQALGVQGTAHVVDVGFSSPLESGIVGPP